MARHRQRARERKLQQPLRENIPGELDHASGDVEEVEAAIIAGADGEPGGLADEEPSDLDAFGRERVPEEADGGDGGGGGRRRVARGSGEPAPRERRPRTGAIAFLRASWAELQRVQWPDRRQVGQATAVVLGFVAIAGAYLGIADTIAQKIVNLII